MALLAPDAHSCLPFIGCDVPTVEQVTESSVLLGVDLTSSQPLIEYAMSLVGSLSGVRLAAGNDTLKWPHPQPADPYVPWSPRPANEGEGDVEGGAVRTYPQGQSG